MNGTAPASSHDAAPEIALATIRDFQGPLLIDLDETLYLGNSTEDFIDSARPGLAALVLLKLLDWIAPWRWTGGLATRDGWRLRMILRLLPWTLSAWQRRVPELSRRYANEPLAQTLREHRSPLVILTLGFEPVVRPLIAALAVDEREIVAACPYQPQDRLHGKLALAHRRLGRDLVASALTLGDSTDDLPLLDASARPLRTIWPQARFRPALRDVYLPGRYIEQVKRPGERHIQRAILQEDFAFWLISSIGFATFPPLHLLGLLALLLSFWAIYECGYVDNDRIAARYEREPKLSAAFRHSPVATPTLQPWLWALASGLVAIGLLRWPLAPTRADCLIWLAMLLGTHFWFRLYNRYDKTTRVWLYAGLQLLRTAAFVVLVPVVPVAALALGAHVLAKWMAYYIYRFSGKDWPDSRVPLIRLMFFLVLVLLTALTQGSSNLLSLTGAALLGWNLYRARDDLRATLAGATRLDRPPFGKAGPSPPTP